MFSSLLKSRTKTPPNSLGNQRSSEGGRRSSPHLLPEPQTLISKSGFIDLGVSMRDPKVKAVASPPASPSPSPWYHDASIAKPQNEYNTVVNNSYEPFRHVWLEWTPDGSRPIHPLEKLSAEDFAATSIMTISQPVKPPSVEDTPFTLVDDFNKLTNLASKLREVDEFAVDLEHNKYRSYQGLTCLMQISTRTEDFVIDTFKCRLHLGLCFRDIFKDPSKRKVMHGASNDILWLQRDFHLYVCNLFDTMQASKVLNLEKNSLEYLLQHFCGVSMNKEYQTSDWRVRPIPDEMLKYAREDTHHLLYIYDLMMKRLLESSGDGNCQPLVLEVYNRSIDTCMQFYEKEVLTDSSYLNIYGLDTDFDSKQLAIVDGLYRWRDQVAREEDESTGYILPNRVLLDIARQIPSDLDELHLLVKSKTPYALRRIRTIFGVIQSAISRSADYESTVEMLKEQDDFLHDARQGFSGISSKCVSSTPPLKDVCTDVKAKSIDGTKNRPSFTSAKDNQIQTESFRLLPLPEIGRFFMPKIDGLRIDDTNINFLQSSQAYMLRV